MIKKTRDCLTGLARRAAGLALAAWAALFAGNAVAAEYEIVEDWTSAGGGNWVERTIRRNSDGQCFKVVKFTSTDAPIYWTVPAEVTSIEYLVVGGGGTGGPRENGGSGGGGAGGFLTGTEGVDPGTVFTVTVGEGGVGYNGVAPASGGSQIAGIDGGDSILLKNGEDFLTAKGGGAGAGGKWQPGRDGGSGGGACWQGGAGGKCFGNQGHAGGAVNAAYTSGAGGGGAGAEGGPMSSNDGAAGGDGEECDITGRSLWYAGGGGGGASSKSAGTSGGVGGKGGGGSGTDAKGRSESMNGVDGTGGGGGGLYNGAPQTTSNELAGGKGGSGVVILRYATQSGTPITEDMIEIYPESTPYTGSAITPTVTVNDGTKDLVEGTDYTLSGNEAKTTVDTYTITVTGKGAYTGEASKTWSITKAENAVTAPTIDGWTYGATPKQPSGSTATFGTVQYRYFTSGDAAMDAPTASTAAGTYKVQAYVEGTANYNDAASAKVEFIISKAANAVSAPSIENWTYGETPKQPSATATFGTVQYRYFTSGDAAMDAPTTSTAAGTYQVQAYVEGTANYNGAESEKVSFTIAKAETQILSVTMKSFKTTDATVPTPTCSTQPAAAASGATYTYWADPECATTEIQRAALKDQSHGTYYVKATIAESANYTGASASASFEIIDPTVQKTPVTPPSPTSKPYNGRHQTSGIGSTPQYTVTELAGDHIHVGTYPVTLTLTEPSTHKWADTEDSQPRTVDFSITKADNSWNQPPSVTPTQWWVGESGTFGDGSAKWNDGAKYAKWYRIDGATRTELGGMPTAAGSYARVVTVPGTDDYNELTREVGFTIYAYGEKTPVPVPVIPDQDWTGSPQTANVPVSGFYTVTENPSKQDLGTYDTVKLQLNDTAHTQWADGTTADKTISWSIVKAKNAWTVEPELTAYVVAPGEEAPAVKTAGKDKFGNVVSGTHDTDNHTWTFTVAGNGNYEGLTKVLAYTVSTDTKGTGDFTWNVAGSGAWTLAGNWKRTNENPSTVYPDDAAASVTFDSASGTQPITVVRPDVATTTIKSLTVDASAPDLTLRMGGKSTSYSFLDLSAKDSSLTIGAGRKVRFEDGILFAYNNKVSDSGADVSLGANAELTVKVGKAFFNGETVQVGDNAEFSGSFRAERFTMADGSRLIAEGDYTRVGFVNTFNQSTKYTL